MAGFIGVAFGFIDGRSHREFNRAGNGHQNVTVGIDRPRARRVGLGRHDLPFNGGELRVLFPFFECPLGGRMNSRIRIAAEQRHEAIDNRRAFGFAEFVPCRSAEGQYESPADRNIGLRIQPFRQNPRVGPGRAQKLNEPASQPRVRSEFQ